MSRKSAPVQATASSAPSGDAASASQPFSPPKSSVERMASELGSSSTKRDTAPLM